MKIGGRNKQSPLLLTSSLKPLPFYITKDKGKNMLVLHFGAALLAYNKFGAIWGQGVGLQGQSYGIPTMHGGVEAIKPYVDEFIAFAATRLDLTFLVTRIGCGIAGFRDEEIAPLFKEALDAPNIVLPESFVTLLLPKC